ncbi:MAG: peptidoglycan DD-metalloendopeptidase family protein [Bacteroidales bacterium]|nr:peptidoglycan DD-metalloendopeptidase family protein [Bacteroidales bacterium]
MKTQNGKIFLMIALLIGLLFPMSIWSQNKNALEKSKRNLEKEIGYTRKLLKETENQKKVSINEISLLNKQIKSRQELIEVYNREISQAEIEIKQAKKQIEELQASLKKLKEEYGKMIYQTYKSRNAADQWMYVFSSNDFYQAYNRIKYLRAIGEARKEAAQNIVDKESELNQRIAALEQIKQDRINLMTSKEQEASNLIHDKSRKEIAVKKISEKEKELKQQLAQKQKEWQKLNDEIKKIIAAQMKKAGKADKEAGRLPLTPEEKLLAESFAGNKGKLPWPLERGQIISSFGSHPHPELHVTVDNKGVDIRTEKMARARVVFEGKVVRIIQLGRFKAVLIQHGSYFTVYSNLSEVYVTEGQKVNTKDELGLVGTSNETGETILHFELWSTKTNKPQNPEYWINK